MEQRIISLPRSSHSFTFRLSEPFSSMLALIKLFTLIFLAAVVTTALPLGSVSTARDRRTVAAGTPAHGDTLTTTNAARFAHGLGPLPPKHFYFSTRMPFCFILTKRRGAAHDVIRFQLPIIDIQTESSTFVFCMSSPYYGHALSLIPVLARPLHSPHGPRL